jgi:hypothetical protein
MTSATIPRISCPECDAIDWGQDGFAVWADDVRVDLGVLRPALGADEPWTCLRCGHRLARAEPLAGALSSLREAHLE